MILILTQNDEDKEKQRKSFDDIINQIVKAFDLVSKRFESSENPFNYIERLFSKSEQVFNKIDETLAPLYKKAKKIDEIIEKYYFILDTLTKLSNLGSQHGDNQDLGKFFPNMVS